MKVLYLTPMGIQIDAHNDPEGKNPYDMENIYSAIAEGVEEAFDDIKVTILRDILIGDLHFTVDSIKGYDLYLCDLTTANPNVSHLSGIVEGLEKPIIYFAASESSIPMSLSDRRILRYSDKSRDKDFREILNQLILFAKDDPTKLISDVTKETPHRAFISYSHSDQEYLDRLMVHLKPLMKKGLIDIWSDKKIKTGDQWKVEIEAALTEASISILLISADFMASDFIVDNELPPILAKAEVKGTKILPVILSPCRFSREPTLNRFQAANSPSEPLSGLSFVEREVVFDKLASDIERTLENA
jgi:TIR domain